MSTIAKLTNISMMSFCTCSILNNNATINSSAKNSFYYKDIIQVENFEGHKIH